MIGYLDVDTTDAFLDGPDTQYEDGKSSIERLKDQGYDTSDLGTLAEQMEARGRVLTPIPTIDH